MRRYHSILYISHGTAEETEGLKQALSLANNNKASLRILVVCPEFPSEFPEYYKKYEESLIDQARSSINFTREALKLKDEEVDISIDLVSGSAPANKIIQQVLQHDHDLVIKEAEPRDNSGGFLAIDMDLLRKCPCAVWLCRPIEHSRQAKVAVAIDPENQEAATRTLSVRMLQLSRSVADCYQAELHIISCWDYEFEECLRGFGWSKLSDDEIAETVLMTKQANRATLEDLIDTSKISGDYQIHHLRGQADIVIPSFTQENHIDILVMGTVARTGIPGFTIGNTAENIVQKLSCSLMALKPRGFVSPVKAYR